MEYIIVWLLWIAPGHRTQVVVPNIATEKACYELFDAYDKKRRSRAEQRDVHSWHYVKPGLHWCISYERAR